MATRYRHYKGSYLGYFSPGKPMQVNSFTFQDLRWESIEIKNIESVKERIIDAEKVGDYIYLPKLKVKAKNKLVGVFKKGIDVVIVGRENQAFSEDLHHVILRKQAGRRLDDFQSVRESNMVKINDYLFCSSGVILFSIPYEEQVETSVPNDNLVDTIIQIPVAEAPYHEITRIPDLVMNPERQDTNFSSNITVPGKLGCLGRIWKFFKWYLFLMLIYFVFTGITNWVKGSSAETERYKTDDGAIQSSKPRLNPLQDTFAQMPWDYLTDHSIEWSDFITNRYVASYATSSKSYEDSKKQHNAWANPQTNDVLSFWNGLYAAFSAHDYKKLDSLVTYFDNERRQKNLDPAGTAEMVVAFIQEIPYYLIHEGTCKEASEYGGFVQEYHASGKPCLPGIVAGVQTPYEFIHNLKGDCDTRSLLGFTLLSRLGIPTSIWISEVYGHSVLGVGVPGPSNNIKNVKGFRHAGVELTAKGFRIGMLAAEHANMNNWDVVLYNNP